ncbi:sensor domain-containing phosphodiesterase [Enterobacteriaceae bacterium YMB-R22]|jgi:EAL domain-containing protein (putative c-di-GMP-specific phosphodiesterase class I)/GGDEF domain-containing protein|uniref:EAL domain-containing protein n=1 Tax=Tenebrionicola larvae TaxID=2815733 RepID=UPI002013749F|nr:EAL domain-containing protein [Tenebrionicola larvae]MBV4411824.1 sensor domain-containing phosphodiesterase [Tenebrionicola larvae]
MTRLALFSLRKSITALALLLPLLFISRALSPRAVIDGSDIFLTWLPLSVVMAMTLIFGRVVILPLLIALALFFTVVFQLPALQMWVFIFCLLGPLILACALLRVFLGSRWRFRPLGKGLGARLFWFGFVTPSSMKLTMYFSGQWIDFPAQLTHYFGHSSTLFIIVDMLGMTAAGLIFTFLFYYPLRMMLSLAYARAFLRSELFLSFTAARRGWAIGWLAMLAMLLLTLCWPTHTILISGYLVPLIFIVFTIGIRHFGVRTTHFLWAFSTWLLLTLSENFLYGVRTSTALTFILSVFISFTVCLLYMSNLYCKSVWARQIYYAQAMTDPLTQLPNLRALEQHVVGYPGGVLCCLRMANLEFWSQHYGMALRIYCKRKVTQLLAPWLHDGERVFQLPGSELLIFLRGPEPQQRLSHMVDLLNSRNISWNGDSLDIEFGAAWGSALHLTPDEMHRMLGQLGWLAHQACSEHRVAALNDCEEAVSDVTSERVQLLRQIKAAVENDRFTLYAQPIHNREGQGYSEILCRMFDDKGAMIVPDKFIPIVAEFNLSARFDMQVLKKLLGWLRLHPAACRSARFSVNLMPFTLMQKEAGRDIVALFERYGVAPQTVIIEVTEAQALSDVETSLQNIALLRGSGFRIAIDDFGTGYANYKRLRDLRADIIKIDGCFITEILTNSLDAQIVKSICDLAHARGWEVIAEYVETPEQRDLLLSFGVDFLQGWLIGKPEPLVR